MWCLKCENWQLLPAPNEEGTTESVTRGNSLGRVSRILSILYSIKYSVFVFNLNAEYIMQNAWLDEAQAGIQIARRNTNNLSYASDDTTLMAESKEELKGLLVKVEEETEKARLKLSIQKMEIMASGPITSRQINGEKLETVTDFIFLGSKITVDGHWSHDIKRRLLLGRKAMTNLNSILKSRDITLPTKLHLAKAMTFPVVMYDLRFGQ